MGPHHDHHRQPALPHHFARHLRAGRETALRDVGHQLDAVRAGGLGLAGVPGRQGDDLDEQGRAGHGAANSLNSRMAATPTLLVMRSRTRRALTGAKRSIFMCPTACACASVIQRPPSQASIR